MLRWSECTAELQFVAICREAPLWGHYTPLSLPSRLLCALKAIVCPRGYCMPSRLFGMPSRLDVSVVSWFPLRRLYVFVRCCLYLRYVAVISCRFPLPAPPPFQLFAAGIALRFGRAKELAPNGGGHLAMAASTTMTTTTVITATQTHLVGRSPRVQSGVDLYRCRAGPDVLGRHALGDIPLKIAAASFASSRL